MPITLNDLKFEKHHTGCGEQAKHEFPNGYGVSVLRGCPEMWYTNGGSYELAVMVEGGPCYDTPITSDVLGTLSEQEVNETLLKIEQLPSRLGES